MNFLNTLSNVFKFAKNHYKLLCFVYAVLATFLLVGMAKKYQEKKDEIKRMSANQEILVSDVETYKTESGKNAARIKQLELTKDEFEKLCKDQAEIIEDLGIKVKRLQYVSSSQVNTEIEINTDLKDTVLITKHDTVYTREDAKYFKWNDNWNRIEGIVHTDKVDCKYSGVDTLTVAASKVPHKFWFIKWGCKYVDVNIVNQNPSSHVTWNRTVRVK